MNEFKKIKNAIKTNIQKCYYFNFFDQQKFKNEFLDFYGVDPIIFNNMKIFFQSNNLNDLDSDDYIDKILLFIADNNIDITKDVTQLNKIYFHCRHFTTDIDYFKSNNSFKKFGILNNIEVLKKDTSLKKFLNNNGIFFDVDKKEITYNDKTVSIDIKGTSCNDCPIQNCNKELDIQIERCFDDESGQTNIEFCYFANPITDLFFFLYNTRPNINAYLYKKANQKNVTDYSTISMYSEILMKIENAITSLFEIKLDLCDKWLEQAESVYLDFDAKSDEIDLLSYVQSSDEFCSIYERYLANNFEERQYLQNIVNIKNQKTLEQNQFNILINLFIVYWCMQFVKREIIGIKETTLSKDIYFTLKENVVIDYSRFRTYRCENYTFRKINKLNDHKKIDIKKLN